MRFVNRPERPFTENRLNLKPSECSKRLTVRRGALVACRWSFRSFGHRNLGGRDDRAKFFERLLDGIHFLRKARRVVPGLRSITALLTQLDFQTNNRAQQCRSKRLTRLTE